MKEDATEKHGRWKLDRHVPVALVITIMVQTGAWIWWAASFSTATEIRLGAAERKLDAMAGINERMASVEARLATTNDILIDIRDQLKDARRRRDGG